MEKQKNSISKKRKSRGDEEKKQGGLEAIVNVDSAIKKYKKEVAPSNDNFLLWR